MLPCRCAGKYQNAIRSTSGKVPDRRSKYKSPMRNAERCTERLRRPTATRRHKGHEAITTSRSKIKSVYFVILVIFVGFVAAAVGLVAVALLPAPGASGMERASKRERNGGSLSEAAAPSANNWCRGLESNQ